MRTVKACVLLLLSFWGSSVGASVDTIRIVTPHWEGWTNEDGSGFYFDLVNKIFGEQGLKVEWQIVPFKRARVMVTNGVADAMFGVWDETFYSGAIITPEYPVDVGQYAAVFERSFSWQGISSFENQNVAMPLGYMIDQHLPDSFRRISVKDSEMGLRMLLAGRVNLFVSDQDEILAVFKKHSIDRSRYRVEAFSEHNLYMGFSNNSKGEALRSIYDREMAQLVKDETIEGLYKKYGHFVDVLRPRGDVLKTRPENMEETSGRSADSRTQLKSAF